MQFIEKVLPQDTVTAMPDSAIHWLAKSDPEALTQSLKQMIDESKRQAFARNVKLFLRLSVLGQENAVLTKVADQLAPGMLARLQKHRLHTESGSQPRLDHLLVDVLAAFSKLNNHGCRRSA